MYTVPICIPRRPTVSAGATAKDNHYYEATVGPPLACSLAIVDSVTQRPLPYGQTGEIAVAGPAAIPAYFSINNSSHSNSNHHTATHTPEGWLLTGDVGTLEPTSGKLFIVGRSKEMIKRGGTYYVLYIEYVAYQYIGI